MLVTSQLPIQAKKFLFIFFIGLVPPHFEKGSATHAHSYDQTILFSAFISCERAIKPPLFYFRLATFQALFAQVLLCKNARFRIQIKTSNLSSGKHIVFGMYALYLLLEN